MDYNHTSLPSDNRGVSYSYDPTGNRIDRLETPNNGLVSGTQYSYDYENRLTQVQDYQLPGADDNRVERAVTDLAYDAGGRRLISAYDPKTGNGGTKETQYLFDGLDPVGEYQMLNNQYTNFYRGVLGRMASSQTFKQGTQGQLFYYHYNAKYDVSALTKQNGQSVHNYQYDPYGGVEHQNGNFTAPHNEYTLTGKETDGHTNLVYFGARHYDPEVGVWLTQDVYRGQLYTPMSLHRYLFVYQSPNNFTDAYGYTGGWVISSRLYPVFFGGNQRLYIRDDGYIDYRLDLVATIGSGMDVSMTYTEDVPDIHLENSDKGQMVSGIGIEDMTVDYGYAATNSPNEWTVEVPFTPCTSINLDGEIAGGTGYHAELWGFHVRDLIHFEVKLPDWLL